MKTINIAALNIKLDTPGKTKRYIDLIHEVVASQIQSKVISNDFIEFRNMSEIVHDEPDNGFIGTVVRYTIIDDSLPCYDRASQKDCRINWPDNVMANRRNINFVFYPKEHRLLFSTEFITPQLAFKSMNRIFKSTLINDKFGFVAVELETSAGAIERIKSMSVKKSLTIHITIPNPDAPTQAAEKVRKRLQEACVRKAKLEEKSDDPNGIIFGEEENGWLDLAKSNGRVLSRGMEQGARVSIDTRNHPATYKWKVNEDEYSVEEFIHISNEALSQIVGNNGK